MNLIEDMEWCRTAKSAHRALTATEETDRLWALDTTTEVET